MNQTKEPNTNQLDSLVLLRGIAVLLVCFCHFGNALSGGHVFAEQFKWFHKYGIYGVHIFFVISGFVIPLSLLKGEYTILDFGRFLYKRVLRLHPPYLAALVLTFVIMFFSYKSRGIAFPENALSILKSTIYLHVPGDNPVFWTLIVEAQYYIFIGIFYSLLMRYPRVIILLLLPTILLLSQTDVTKYISLLEYIPFFLIGTIGFLIYTDSGIKLLNIIALLALIIFAGVEYKTPAILSAAFTIFIILTVKMQVPKLLQWPGKISYSIYLIHFPIGIKLINLTKRFIPPSYGWVLFVAAMIIVFVASRIFYKIFEEFSEKLSRKIKYNEIANRQQSDQKISTTHP